MGLKGDAQRLSQILTNLLSNAIKFTQEGEISLVVHQVSNDRFKFTIKDTGIGLTDEQLKKVFYSFTQADSTTTRKYGGSGLGLSISKQLVELMDGEIWVESEFEKGSTFIFEVRLEASDVEIQRKLQDNSAKNEKENNNITSKLTQKLFDELRVAVYSRRPHLCEPIIKKIDKSDLSKDDEELFTEVKKLVIRYKFNEAKELLDEK